tara:strand:+ start:883 stop:1008 length:126 start_codon:yes stop_codon:yes gene_type:complete
MIKQLIYDTAIVGCILVSSGFSLALVYGAVEEIYYRHKNME